MPDSRPSLSEVERPPVRAMASVSRIRSCDPQIGQASGAVWRELPGSRGASTIALRPESPETLAGGTGAEDEPE